MIARRNPKRRNPQKNAKKCSLTLMRLRKMKKVALRLISIVLWILSKVHWVSYPKKKASLNK